MLAPGHRMRILYVADLHYSLKQFDWLLAQAESHDVVVIAGDLLDLAGVLEPQVQVVVVEKYLARLAARRPLIVSSGNHDGDRRSAADESVAGWLVAARGARVHVDGDSVEIGGTLFTVCPWWDGPVSRDELERQLERDAARRTGRWVWVHHAPPDRTPISWTGRKFAGDAYLGGWIERYRPDLVLSGHIHNSPFLEGGSWYARVGQTWGFNPGRQIGPVPTFITIDLERGVASWMSFQGPVGLELGPGAKPGPE